MKHGCLNIIALAQNSCVLKGETSSLPSILSDVAMLEFRMSGRAQDALLHLETAVQILSRQGRLDLGGCNLVASNQVVVSNYVKLLSRVGYRRTVDFIADRVDWGSKPSQSNRATIVAEIDRIVGSSDILFAVSPDPYRVTCPFSGLTLIG